MVSFKTYLAEYVKTEEGKLFNIVKLKSGKNGKDFNRIHTRKNANTITKKYTHKNPLVSNMVNGSNHNVSLKGASLNQILTQYNIAFEPGIKTLGNSSAELEMYEDEEGMQCGILRRKRTNGM